MRRFIVSGVFAFVTLAMLAPPGFAQAPAPKVTISGLFDQVTSASVNLHDGNLTRTSDREWYARTRFRPDFEFAVGRVKAVLGIEIDLMYGQAGPNDGGFPGNVSGQAGGVSGGTKVNANGNLDLNTDVGGMLEVKWIYTEFPLTGKDSLLPFIPIETMARAGGQPFAGLAHYKLAQYANGDFAGISAITTILPNLKSNLAWVILEDQLAGANRGNPSLKTGRGEDHVLIASADITPTKGLDIKPLYSWLHADGQTSGTARRNLVNRGTAGGTLNGTAAFGSPDNPPAAGDPSYHEDRHTIGVDARWRIGPFGLDPTFYYQWGRIDRQSLDRGPTSTAVEPSTGTKKVTADMSAFLFDIIASYQLGPLLLEGRGMYSTGNKARDNLAKGIRYYQPLDTDGNYYAGDWTVFWSSWSSGDYFTTGFAGTGNYVGYDRYGSARATFRATYNFTPALSTYFVVGPTFTAEEVDTDTNSGRSSAAGVGTPVRTTVSQNSWVDGDSRYLGTEVNLGLVWRFSPNTAFTLIGGYLFAGDGLDTAECITPTGAAGNAACSNGTVFKRDAEDAYAVAARVRLAF
jgi:hypothetical protein